MSIYTALLAGMLIGLPGGPKDTLSPEEVRHPGWRQSVQAEVPPSDPTAYRAFAIAAYQDGDYGTAARYFAAAARGTAGVRRGVLEARAGDALERAGVPGAAVPHYRAAMRLLPIVAPWVAIRLARLMPDTVRAFELLRRAPKLAHPLAVEVRGELLAAWGDYSRAVAELAGTERYGHAAAVALAAGDSGRAQALAFAALNGADTAEAMLGLDLLAGSSLVRQREQRLVVARELERRARYGEASRWYGRIVAMGDNSAVALLAWGNALERAGDRAAALRVYARAATAPGDSTAAAAAEFARARLTLRRGRTRAGLVALLAFVRHHPDHSSVPLALMAIAEERQETGLRRRADSLYQRVVRDWPGSSSATEARFRLAGRALARRELGRARTLYAGVAEAGGANALAARFVLGRLALRAGDTASANAQWMALARDDPLGYYGTLARGAAGAGGESFPEAAPLPATPAITSDMMTLGLLDAMGFDLEGDALVSQLVAKAGYTPEQTLELAGGLLARGRPTVAATLGWRAARGLSLNDPRVLRVIFPWPWRALIEDEAKEFGIDPYLLAAVIRQESGFRRAITSRAGARGLMQLMPGTAALTASRLRVPWRDRFLTVPDANLHLGAAHLAMLLRRYRGKVVTALAAYNAGSRPAERWSRSPDARDPFWFVEAIPYPETRGYVRSVVRNRAMYEALYPPVAAR
jgi:soluble lytic murein transglycosylase